LLLRRLPHPQSLQFHLNPSLPPLLFMFHLPVHLSFQPVRLDHPSCLIIQLLNLPHLLRFHQLLFLLRLFHLILQHSLCLH
jgi:hypothetical protein